MYSEIIQDGRQLFSRLVRFTADGIILLFLFFIDVLFGLNNMTLAFRCVSSLNCCDCFSVLTFTSVRPYISLYFQTDCSYSIKQCWDAKVNVFLLPNLTSLLKHSNEDSLWVVIFCSLACFFLLTVLMCVHHWCDKAEGTQTDVILSAVSNVSYEKRDEKRAMSENIKRKVHSENILWQTNVLFFNILFGKCLFFSDHMAAAEKYQLRGPCSTKINTELEKNKRLFFSLFFERIKGQSNRNNYFKKITGPPLFLSAAEGYI